MRLNLARKVFEAGGVRLGDVFDLARLSRPGQRAENEAQIRASASSAYLGEHAALCRVLGRYKLNVDTRDVALSSHLLLDGYWEMWSTEVIARRVKPGMVVADIGANLGYFAVMMADLVGPQGVVHAFEPNPAMAERLRRNLTVNGFERRARVHGLALSGRDDEAVELVVDPQFPSAAHIVPCRTGAAALRTRRLDSFPELFAADFLKIDVEGAERAIWDGMAGVLQAGRPMTILLEFAPVRYADPGGFLAAIAAEGFSLALVDRDRGEQPASRTQILNAGPQEQERMLLLCR